ncbi:MULTISPECIES: RNA 2',3'-cyclic phosphodiesterase [unclassified Rhizobium]|uniref:RNA 2',3'-cyclic phosphodiesterase n=1 Tax=unclassified Rhizobium TaxID=2613769 RepID=UPI00161F2421|nr:MULTISPECIES: RNA 2',3'-cyclic phosphodiesterase [unclassified Rhizobium]MBB3391273.1 2'-5' RNA ligase [Rhizobium sp. BK275]MBB3411645.1 2'-5' RNA ligase [Rhizobium sp. BK316]QWW67566.1 RNA 2',3'-cyclic phosphodiesterase [Rhizobium sp. WYJ-E13]
MPRLFTALEIPRNAAMSLSLLRGGLPGARWIDVENYHITLRFIGDVDGRTADEIVERLDRIDRPEFQLRLDGIGSFGSKKPHSIWAGVSPSPEMYALQGEIERICQRIGLPPDPRKFTPHVTLARLKYSRVDDVVHYLAGRGNFQTSTFTVPRFVLLSSRESVGGGPYLTEEVFPLHEPLMAPSLSTSVLQPAKSLA